MIFEYSFLTLSYSLTSYNGNYNDIIGESQAEILYKFMNLYFVYNLQIRSRSVFKILT